MEQTVLKIPKILNACKPLWNDQQRKKNTLKIKTTLKLRMHIMTMNTTAKQAACLTGRENLGL